MPNTSSFPPDSKRRCNSCDHVVTHRGWELHKTTMHAHPRQYIHYTVVVKQRGKWVPAK